MRLVILGAVLECLGLAVAGCALILVWWRNRPTRDGSIVARAGAALAAGATIRATASTRPSPDDLEANVAALWQQTETLGRDLERERLDREAGDLAVRAEGGHALDDLRRHVDGIDAASRDRDRTLEVGGLPWAASGLLLTLAGVIVSTAGSLAS
jgi:uncharacterized Zn-binding protein involved in type VI secretion